MTTRLFDTLEFAAEALDDLHRPWALIGGLALSVYAEPRFTADIDIAVDLLFASSGIESEIAQPARTVEIVEGLQIPVARPGHLFALKLLSVDADERPQDVIDLRQLARQLDDEESETVRRAIELIDGRGYARGRDLEALLEEYGG